MLVKSYQQLYHIFLESYIWQYFSIKESSENALSHIFWVVHQSGIESNTKGQLSTALSHISWVWKHSGTNCIIEG